MVEYRRVMFLDADLIPLVNLDYLFHLSDPGHTQTPTILRPNFLIATRGEPCNTAFFVVEPSLERYKLLQMAIDRQHEAGRKLPYPHFSKSDGWGHNFQEAGDFWKAIFRHEKKWTFHAAHSDQGLMYYYAKYLVQDTTIAIGDQLQHWGPQTDGSNEGKDYRLTKPQLLSEDKGTLTELSPIPVVWQNYCDQDPEGAWQCPAPYRNLAHFPGKEKPWMIGVKSFAPTNSTMKMKAAYRLWFRTLDELNRELTMGLDVENWLTEHMTERKTPSLGHMAKHADLARQVYQTASFEANSTNPKWESAKKTVPSTERNYSLANKGPSSRMEAALEERSLAAPQTKPVYAIMWIIGGIHEDRPNYKGFLYDVLISARILDQQGSTADRILWVQLSPDSQRTALDAEELRWLHTRHVQVRYLEKDEEHESFSLLVYKKFHAIKMVEYRRVMFLDADLIPLANLDYLFHLSDPGHTQTPTILRPNFLIATRGEPCNTAFFVVEPSLERYKLLQMAIDRQHEAGRKLPYPYFSNRDGWGHNFQEAGDYWKSRFRLKRKWTFHAAHSDQGLMYYYAKYLIQDATIAIGDELQHWGPQTDGSNEGKDYRLTKPKLLSEEQGTLTKLSPVPKVWQFNCDHDPGAWQCPAPYRHLAHFPGKEKPWMRGFKSFAPTNDSSEWKAAYRLWFRTLNKLNGELSMGMDMKHWNTKHMPELKVPSLGHAATHWDLATQVYKMNSTEANSINTKPEIVKVVSTTVKNNSLTMRAEQKYKHHSKPNSTNTTSKTAKQVMPITERSLAAANKKPVYAIMWILGGVHEDRPSYKGFLYNVLVSARMLDRQGSTADRILWVQLSPDSQKNALNAEELRWLNARHVQVRYLEKDEEHESFGLLVYKVSVDLKYMLCSIYTRGLIC